MNGYNRTGGSNAFLRVFSCAGVLAVLLACAGATRVVDDDSGAGYVSMPATVGAAIGDDSIEVWGRSYV